MEILDIEAVGEILLRMETEMNLALTDWGLPQDFILKAEKAAKLFGVKVQRLPLEDVWLAFAALLGVLDV